LEPKILSRETVCAHGVRTGYVGPMAAPPTFAPLQEHDSRLGDVGFWWPYVAEILKRHELADAGREPVAGFNADVEHACPLAQVVRKVASDQTARALAAKRDEQEAVLFRQRLEHAREGIRLDDDEWRVSLPRVGFGFGDELGSGLGDGRVAGGRTRPGLQGRR
jgi:hypothetical protein